MRIDEFKAKAPHGFSRTNRYAVYFDNPSVMINTSNLPMILMFCDRIDLPGLNLNTTQIREYGEIREMPYEFNYDPIPMSFYVDTDMMVKTYFDRWIKSVQNPTNRNFNYYKDYTCGKMSIEVQDLNDNTKYKVELFDAYPKTLFPVSMGYENKEIMRMQVVMAYRYWRSAPMNSQAAVSVGSINPFNPNSGSSVFNLSNPQGEQSFRDIFSEFSVERFDSAPWTDWRRTQEQFNNYGAESQTGVTGIVPDVQTFRVF